MNQKKTPEHLDALKELTGITDPRLLASISFHPSIYISRIKKGETMTLKTDLVKPSTAHNAATALNNMGYAVSVTSVNEFIVIKRDK